LAHAKWLAFLAHAKWLAFLAHAKWLAFLAHAKWLAFLAHAKWLAMSWSLDDAPASPSAPLLALAPFQPVEKYQ
jgi:hypothetical protein